MLWQRKYGLFVWALTTSFFAYQFILRLMPGLIIDDVLRKFQIDAGDYGILTSTYYWGYAGLQIPIAILLDRYSPRFVVGLFVLVVSLATLLFIWTDSWPVAILARFLVGAGSALGFLGVSKVVNLWFPEKLYGIFIGLSFSFGLLGAVYGGKPVASLVDSMGWETAFSLIAYVGIGLFLLIFLFLQMPPAPEVKLSEEMGHLGPLASVLKKPLVWILGIANLLLVGPLEGFADVWGVSYLMKAYDWAKPDAAFITSFIFIGMLFGGPILSLIARLLQRTLPVILFAGLGMATIFYTLFLNPALYTSETLIGAMLIVGIFCCYQVLVFTFGTTMVSSSEKGITVALLNSMNMFGGAFFHYTMGTVINLYWSGGMEGGIKAYDLKEYTIAMYVIPTACVIGVAMLCLLMRGMALRTAQVKVLATADSRK